jgi:hypothetical protein
MVPTGSFAPLLRRAHQRRVPAALVGATLGLVCCGVCCGNVIIDGASGQGAGGAGGTGGVGGAFGFGGAGGGTTDGGCPALTSSTGGDQRVTQCFAPPVGGCPSQYAAAMFITPDPCTYLVLVDCGPLMESGTCCYVVTEQPHPCGS